MAPDRVLTLTKERYQFDNEVLSIRGHKDVRDVLRQFQKNLEANGLHPEERGFAQFAQRRKPEKHV